MWFDADDFKSSHLGMDHFKEWAGEIANTYLSVGAPPTETLSKIAQSEDLKPHQIELLAAEANKAIHAHKYASVDEKYFAADFPLADAKAVIEGLQLGGETKVAHFIEPIFTDKGPGAFEMFGVKPQDLDNTSEVRFHLKLAEEKTQALDSRNEDAIIVKEAEHRAQTFNFIKQARQYLLSESDSLARMKVLGVLDHFVKEAGIPAGRKVLCKLAYVLEKEGKLEPTHAKKVQEYFSKEADCKAPEEFISQDLKIRVINGNHPLYITLKTIGDLEREILLHEEEGRLVKDRARILKQKIRAL